MSAARRAWKVLVTHPEVPTSVVEMMQQRGCETIVCQSLPLSRAEILEKLPGVDALFWAGHLALNAEVLDTAGPQLKAISTMSAGIDFVDVAELKNRGIPLGHTPNVLNDAVADLSVGLMLAAARRFHEGRRKIESSTWENYHLNWMLGQDLRGSTVGFFGFGGIGQAIATRLSGFCVSRVLYCTRRRVSAEKELEFNATHASFHDLLKGSDFIVIIAPLTPETEGVFNASAFKAMKKSAVLVNVARGGIVQQDDLYEALKTNEIFAAGLDVTTPEPLPADHPLLSLPNCVIVPHIGSATEGTRLDMAIMAAENVLKGLHDEPMLAPAY